jgi:hypothetical protein
MLSRYCNGASWRSANKSQDEAKMHIETFNKTGIGGMWVAALKR